MRRRAVVVLLSAVLLVGMAFVLFHRRLLTRYYLWKAHRNPTEVGPWFELCKLGQEATPALVEAAREAGSESRGERTVAVETLVCLRRALAARAIGSELVTETTKADVPLDAAVLDAILAAVEAEVDPSARERLVLFLPEMDFRFQYAL